jgi:hypothetical protein
LKLISDVIDVLPVVIVPAISLATMLAQVDQDRRCSLLFQPV